MNMFDLPLTQPLALPRAARFVIERLRSLRGGALYLRLPCHACTVVGEGVPQVTLEIRSWQVFDRLLTDGATGFAEDWMAQRWDTDDLTALLCLLARNRSVLARLPLGRLPAVVSQRLRHWMRRNTRAGSARNIRAHYDLGNDFYALWLDETMSYSAARFTAPDQTLADAQREKYRHILRTLAPRAGARILEIGCGWGGFAEVAATEFDCQVLGITLSPAQLSWAQARAARGDYARQATFALCDYRDVRGDYDHVVSIEMIEAVGERWWPTYFAQLAARLRPGGSALIQSIVIHESLFAAYRRRVDFVQRHIFPGGMLPTLDRLRAGAARAGLTLQAEQCFGADYARTLAQWRLRFQAVENEVAQLGFDARFRRMWHYYLAYCEAGFATGSTDVCQLRWQRGR